MRNAKFTPFTEEEMKLHGGKSPADGVKFGDAPLKREGTDAPLKRAATAEAPVAAPAVKKAPAKKTAAKKTFKKG